MKLIIDIPEDWEKGIKNMYDWDIANFLYETCRNGTPIPDNATNGDVVKTLFSNTFDNFCERTTWEWNRWWNALYKKGDNSEYLGGELYQGEFESR